MSSPHKEARGVHSALAGPVGVEHTLEFFARLFLPTLVGRLDFRVTALVVVEASGVWGLCCRVSGFRNQGSGFWGFRLWSAYTTTLIIAKNSPKLPKVCYIVQN